MLIESILISLAIGFLIRGKISHLAGLDLQFPWIVMLALGLELAAGVLQRKGIIPVAGTTPWLHLSVYVLLLAFIIANWQHDGIRVLGLGTLMNFLVICFNGGFMPVEVEVPFLMGFDAASENLRLGMVFGHKVMEGGPKTISLGDVVIGIGMGMLIVPQMKKKES